jgi:hypothetical protein
MTDPRDLVVSIHIPKTGGGSFRAVLEAYADGHFRRDYTDRPLAPASVRHRLRLATSRPHLEQGTRVVHGHFIATKYWRRYPDARYAAWFRDPVERLASHYYFWKRSPDPEHPTCRRLIEEDLSLPAFAALPEMRDVHSKLLGEVPVGRLAFAGLTERYDESLELFRRIFDPGLQVRVQRRHVNTERMGERYDLDPDLRASIADLNRVDAQLRAAAQARFEALATQYGVAA